MKTLSVLICFVLSIFIFNSCQNELSMEFPNSAHGTLHDANGDCYPAVVQGIYKQDSTLTIYNFIDVNINISATGNYNLHTDTINGYYFSGSGAVANTGLQTIRLNGHGQPISVGTDIFHLHFDTSNCEIPVEVVSNVTPPAVFTLAGSSGNCSGATLSGTFTAGTAMTASNTVTLNVNVTSGGTYSISTPVVNGVSFSGSGTLTSASTTIVLTAQGTPTASTTNITSNYPVTAGSSNCTFSVVYTGVPVGPASFSFDCATMTPTFPIAGERLRVGQVLNPLTDTIVVQVNVTTAGSYTINTTYGLGGADGVNFNTSGVFTSTGIQTLRLGANGTAGRGGFVFYNISSPQATNTNPCSTGCYYEFLYCAIDGPFNRNFTFLSDVVNDNTSMPGYDLITLNGFSSNSTSENVTLTIGLPTGGDFTYIGSGGSIPYTTNDFPGKYVKAVYTDNSAPAIVYSAETDGTIQSNPFTINITFCTSGRIEGNYTGVVKDNNGAGPGTKTISGSFGLWRL